MAVVLSRAQISPVLLASVALVGIVPFVYLSVCWMFSKQLIVDKQLSFWDAMELSRKVINMHWGSLFLLALICMLVVILGFFALCIGVLVAGPVAVAAINYAYEDIFGTSQPRLT
jgi:uncharacterized membrane protein